MKKKVILALSAMMVVAFSYTTVSAKTEDGSGTPPVGEVGGGDAGDGGSKYKCSDDKKNTCITIKKAGKVIYTEKGVLEV